MRQTLLLVALVFCTMVNVAATENQIRRRRWPNAATSALLALFFGAATLVFWGRGL